MPDSYNYSFFLVKTLKRKAVFVQILNGLLLYASTENNSKYFLKILNSDDGVELSSFLINDNLKGSKFKKLLPTAFEWVSRDDLFVSTSAVGGKNLPLFNYVFKYNSSSKRINNLLLEKSKGRLPYNGIMNGQTFQLISTFNKYTYE